MNNVNVGLSSWIIQDGNYGDFSTGKTYEFALEFYPRSLHSPATQSKQCQLIEGSNYRIRGQLVFSHKEATVIDFGLMAYRQGQPKEEFAVGDWLAGDFYLGIDPFFYTADLCLIVGMPVLLYKFRIDKISLETTPWIETENQWGQKVRSRDKAQRSFKTIKKTDAWHDDDGNAEYVLHCERVD